MAGYLDRLKYIKEWDPKAYLSSKYCDPLQYNIELQHTIDFYSSFPDNSLTILEYSGGPSLLKMISVVPKASKIIFSDFLEQNRHEVKIWLDNEPGAFDWKPAIKHCLKLEGGCGDVKDIRKRESMLQDKIKAVIHCDLASENIIEEGFRGPYDVVNCDGVLDAICKTKEQFIEGVKKLSTLLKKGGHLIVTTDDSDSYGFSDVEFITPIDINQSILEEAFLAAGFIDVSCKSYSSYAFSFLTIGQKG